MAHKPTLGYNGERAALLLWLHPHGYPSAALGRDCPCAHLWLMQLCCQQCAIASRGLLWRATPRFALIETGLKAFVCFVLNNLLAVSLQQPLLLAYSLPGFIFAFYLVKRGEKNTEKKKKKKLQENGITKPQTLLKGRFRVKQKTSDSFQKMDWISAAGTAWCCLNDICWMGSATSYCSWVPV